MKISWHVVEAVAIGIAVLIAGAWIVVVYLPARRAAQAANDAQANSDATLEQAAQGSPLAIMGAQNPYGSLGSGGAPPATVTPGAVTPPTSPPSPPGASLPAANTDTGEPGFVWNATHTLWVPVPSTVSSPPPPPTGPVVLTL